MKTTTLFAAAALSGVIAHHVFFKRVEVDTRPLLIAITFFSAPSALKYFLSSCSPQHAGITYGTSFVIVLCFVLSLWTSMLVYRAFFHPLDKFPGPFPAKFSKLWAFWQTAKTGMKWYQVDEALHKQYGDYVRTGSFPMYVHNEVSYADMNDKGPENYQSRTQRLFQLFLGSVPRLSKDRLTIQWSIQ
jgi:hypothetical protein